MALNMISEKGNQLVKVCADSPRNTLRLLTVSINPQLSKSGDSCGPTLRLSEGLLFSLRA
jgi:hypothetical protein